MQLLQIRRRQLAELATEPIVQMHEHVVFVLLLTPAPFSAKKFDTKNHAKLGFLIPKNIKNTLILDILTPGWKIWHLHRMWCRWQISGKHAFFKKLWTKLYTSFSKVVFTKYFVCTFTIVPNTFLYFSMVTPSMVTLTIFKMGHMLWDHKGRTVSRWHLWVQTVHRWQICHLCL